MTKVKPIKDTTLECMNDLIGDLEHYEQWFNNEEYCKDELKWLKGWSERVKKDLLELQTIKNAEPSKALKCLTGLEKEIIQRDGYIGAFLKIKFDNIKQALLKTEKLEQENKFLKDTLNALIKIDDSDLSHLKIKAIPQNVAVNQDVIKLLKAVLENENS